MKRKKIFSLLLAGTMIGQTLTGGTMSALAKDGSMIGTDQLTNKGISAPEKDKVVPNENQYRYQKDELAAFCHFGPNTFNEIEWGEKYGDRTPDDIFRLEEDFDEQQFVKSIKDAGFKKLIVTAKHHDGFCIWASEHTTYDVSETSYKGDILEELSAACTEYDIDMGLYLSPWDIHDESYGYKKEDGTPLVQPTFNDKGQVIGQKPIDGLTWDDVKKQDAKDYNEYYNNQLKEILGNKKYGNKGHFTEVWMDGAKGSGAGYQEYTFEKWFDTIQQYEGKKAGYDADCMLFGAEAYTTVRWIGNENGYANEETWSKSKVDYEKNTIDSRNVGGYTAGYEDGNQWTVPESDARITSGWFWGTQKNTPKSVADLGGMYFNSVGHNSPLLLNIPPNTQGKVDEAILKRVEEFGKNIRDTFDKNLAAKGKVVATNVRGNDIAYKGDNVLDKNDDTYWTTDDGLTEGSIVIDLGERKTFDVVSIEEAIKFGQRIKEFKVEYRDGNEGEWKPFAQGTTIGAKRLCRSTVVKGTQVKITVKTSKAVPMLSEVGVYKASTDFEAPNGAPSGMKIIDIKDSEFKFINGWTHETGSQYLNGTNAWAKKDAEVEVKFTGSKIYLLGTLDNGHGKAEVTVDGETEEIDTHAAKRAVGQKIFTSKDLKHGEHTLKLKVTDPQKAIGIEGAYVINNDGLGMIGVEKAEYSMNEDSEMEIKLVRVGGSKGEAKVTVSPNPGTAIQDDFDTEGTTTVTFKDGETEKNVVVITRRNTNETGDRYFTEELSTDNKNLILGFNSKTKVTILDQEGRPVDVATKKLPKDAYQKVTATSEEKDHQQTIDKAFDEDSKTFWHANWNNGKLEQNPEGISVEISLKEVKELAKLTYLPRLDHVDGGTIGKYVIEAAVVDEEKPIVEEVIAKEEVAAEGAITEDKVVVEEAITEDDTVLEEATEEAVAENKSVEAEEVAEAGSAKDVVVKENAEENITWVTVCEGEFKKHGNSTTPQNAVFSKPVRTNRIRFTAKSMAGGNHPTAAEIALHAPAQIKTYTVTTKPGENGIIAPVTGALEDNGTMKVQEGKLKTFKMVPNKGYQVADVKANGVSVGAVNRYTVRGTEDVTIEATFKEIVYANYSAVKAALNKIPADLSVYTDASVKILMDAKAAVKWDYDVTRQDEVDAMAKAIEDAIAGLEKKAVQPSVVDKSALEKYYDECIGYYNASDYTTDSWKNYEAALKDAKAILDKVDATQEEVDAAINKLAEAAKNLVKNSEQKQDGKPGKPQEKPGKPQEKPVTGDSATMVVWMTAAVVAGAAVVGVKRRKKEF